MVRIALGLEYAGEHFHGWQSQPHGRTVQDELERALTDIATVPVRVHCAGRTDTGVHATAQVVHFDTSAGRPLSAWVRGANSLLPPSVAVRWAVEVDESFHARFSARERSYRYILFNSPTRPAALAGKTGWFHLLLDVDLMRSAADCLRGTHDFSAFQAAGCQAKTPVRQIREAAIARYGDFIVFDFSADGFLHHMVRNLVGALVYVGKRGFPPEWLAQTLASRDRARSAPTFPPDGLYLCGVRYEPQWSLPDNGRIIALPHFFVS